METWEDWTRLMNRWVWECPQCAFMAFADEAALQAHENESHKQGEEEVMNEEEEEEVWVDDAEEDEVKEVEVDDAEQEEVEEEDVGAQIAGEGVMCLFCKRYWASAATLKDHQKKYRMKFYKMCYRCNNKILTKAEFLIHQGKCKVKV